MTEPLSDFWTDGPPPVDRDAVRPSVDYVAMLERSRTIGAGGVDAGAFSDDTRPTAQEVAQLIEQAVDDVLAQLPDHIDPALYAAIKRLIALRAALTIEASYYGLDTAAAGTWAARFQADLSALRDAIPRATWIA